MARNIFSRSNMDYSIDEVTSEGVYAFIRTILRVLRPKICSTDYTLNE